MIYTKSEGGKCEKWIVVYLFQKKGVFLLFYLIVFIGNYLTSQTRQYLSTSSEIIRSGLHILSSPISLPSNFVFFFKKEFWANVLVNDYQERWKRKKWFRLVREFLVDRVPMLFWTWNLALENQGCDSNLFSLMIFLCELADWAVVSKFLVIFIHNLTVIEAVVAQL